MAASRSPSRSNNSKRMSSAQMQWNLGSDSTAIVVLNWAQSVGAERFAGVSSHAPNS